MNNEEIYQRAIDKWGADAQLTMLKEELAELIVALCKFGREINGTTKAHLAGEVADVELMLQQLHFIMRKEKEDYDWDFHVETSRLMKLARLQDYFEGNLK